MPPRKSRSRSRSRSKSPKRCTRRISYVRKIRCPRSKPTSKSPRRRRSSRSKSPIMSLMQRLTPQAQARIISRLASVQ